jgi:hypothetical protein
MRTMVVYLVLVGTPLLGVIGIIRTGERIVASHPVAGVWELDAESTRRLAAPCLSFVFKKEPAELLVSQSGTYLDLRFADRSRSSLSGTLRGDSLSGELTLPERATCPGAAVDVRAHITAESGLHRMTGTVSHKGCSECPNTHFEAVRRPLDPTE